jgi:predicted nucleic acid-binding protein
VKVFVDANVLFTAAYSPKGKAAALLKSIPKLIVTSDYAAEEARRNILAKKPEVSGELEKILANIRVEPSAAGSACPINLPEKDRPIFMSALKAKASHLLTGDLKDFGPHMNQPKKSAGIVIQTIADFLKGL